MRACIWRLFVFLLRRFCLLPLLNFGMALKIGMKKIYLSCWMVAENFWIFFSRSTYDCFISRVVFCLTPRKKKSLENFSKLIVCVLAFVCARSICRMFFFSKSGFRVLVTCDGIDDCKQETKLWSLDLFAPLLSIAILSSFYRTSRFSLTWRRKMALRQKFLFVFNLSWCSLSSD